MPYLWGSCFGAVRLLRWFRRFPRRFAVLTSLVERDIIIPMKTTEELLSGAPKAFRSWVSLFQGQAEVYGIGTHDGPYPQVYLVVSLLVDGESVGGFMFETVPTHYKPNIWKNWQKSAQHVTDRLVQLAKMNQEQLQDEVENAKLLRKYAND